MAASGSFVHLHCHTHYSLLDGASRIPELVQRVKGQGMNAVAITDHGNLYGAIEFYTECRAAGLNPVIGYEAYVAPGKRTEREAKKRGEAGFHLTLLAQNVTGFKNLIKMATVAFTEGYYYIPRIDKDLLEAHKEGLICLSGCASSEFSEFILKDQRAEAKRVAEYFAKLFGKNFYVEIQSNGLDIQRLCAEGAIDVANQLGLPLVATSDAHYLTRDDAPAHDILLCINTGRTRDDPNRMRYGSDQFYIRGPKEMYDLFPGHADAVRRSQEIADGVDIQLDFKKRHFPVFVPPEGKTPEAYLRELCAKGLTERYGENPSQKVRDRLEHELGIICRMGFASYFLIVGDFVRFAVEKGIPTTARGSACGAMVSYVLKLSHVCPLEYDLLFERFLDPNRAEAPDIDIDFCQDRRELVIQYVREKYGAESVAQIGTFGTLAARAAIKDVGRALNIPLERVIQLTKMIPEILGVTIEESLEQSTDLKQAYDGDPDVRQLLDIAMRLEGTNRNMGTHAAGVVIGNGPLVEHVPLQRPTRKGDDGAKGSEGTTLTTQWVMGDLEKVGLLKMDFLGLRTLTLLDNAARMIKKTRGITIDLQALPLDDPETYLLLQRGDAKGVFQLESDGIRELLKRMRPDNIRDLIAILALYRPGPLEGGMVDTYVNCKHGRETPQYAHPVMKEVLEETYSVLVFQEQIMRILNRLGGIELSSAYACIKAISKKKLEIIDQRRVEFLSGAVERGLTSEKADEIFGFIVEFGKYGFNKCLVGSTVVQDAMTGERITVRDLFAEERAFTVHAKDDSGRLVPRTVERVVWNGRKPVFRLTTELGKTITATGNHPFWTLNGWKNLEELRVGDRVAAPRVLAIPTEKTWPRHELIALGGLLSEGNTCHPSCLYYYNNDPALIEDFAQAIERFPHTVARIDQRKDARREVCASTGRGSGRAERTATGTLPTRSGAYVWAGKLGILEKKADAKFIPAEVFTLRDADVALLLGRMWAGDGHIVSETLMVPFYATSSERLATDVQSLLLRFGIVSRIHRKQFKYRGGLRPGYTAHLLGVDAQERFLEHIAPHCLGREAAVDRLRAYVGSTQRGATSKDTLPAEIRDWVDEDRRAKGWTWKELEERSDVSVQDFQGKLAATKRGFRRETIRKLADTLDSARLRAAASSDLFWDRVVSIEPAGVEDTFDLTVAEDHNFVADGLIVHNSHTAAYAKVGYQTAYLKAHFRPEFMAALLSSEVDDGNKRDILVEHIADARRLGVEVLPPNINTSEADFSVQDGKIVFGLVAIKGVGRQAAEEIVRARDADGPGGKFRDLFDLCERVDLKVVKAVALEKLAKAGALDVFWLHRAQALHVLPRAIQAATERQKDRRTGQKSLFDAFAATDDAPAEAAPPESHGDVPAWSETEKLKAEKEVLDFYFSSHPLVQHERTLRRYATHAVEQIKTLPADEEVLLGGMFSLVRFMNYKKPRRDGNNRYVRCKFEDVTGAVECVMWADEFVRYKDEIADDRIVLVKGVVERSREEPSLVLTRVYNLDQAAREMAKGLHLLMQVGRSRPVEIDALAEVLQRTPGPVPVMLAIRDPAGRLTVLRLSRQFAVNAQTFDQEALEGLLGAGSVKLM